MDHCPAGSRQVGDDRESAGQATGGLIPETAGGRLLTHPAVERLLGRRIEPEDGRIGMHLHQIGEASLQPDREVASGIYRLGTDVVNFYVLAEDGQLTVIDANVPGHFEQLTSLLESRDWDLAAVTAVLLTHAHADHIGFAERARTEAGATVRIHHADEIIATGGDDGRSNEKSLLGYLWRPALYKTLFDLLRGGGTSIVPVAEAASFDDGETLDVPGRPRVVGSSDLSGVMG